MIRYYSRKEKKVSKIWLSSIRDTLKSTKILFWIMRPHYILYVPPPSFEGGKKTSRQGNSGQLLESSATIANLLLWWAFWQLKSPLFKSNFNLLWEMTKSTREKAEWAHWANKSGKTVCVCTICSFSKWCRW